MTNPTRLMTNLTMERTAQIVLFALLFALATRVPVDTDTWWHLRSAETTLTEGMIYEDLFSHTRNATPWTNHSWGAQIVMYGAWELAGNAGLSLYTALLAVGGMALLYPICRGNAYLRGFALVLGAATAAVFWSARPQMFSFLFNCLFMFLLYDWKLRGKDRLWLLPVAMLIWGNLHAGYSIGFLFLFAVIVGESANLLFGTHAAHITWRAVGKLVLVGLVSAAVLVVSPYGLDTLRVPFETVGIGALRQFIQEWNSPNFQGRETWPFIALVMLLLGAFWASRLKFDFSSFFLTIGTLFLALLYSRNLAVFAVAATPILTHHIANVLETHNWVLRTRRKATPMMARLNLALIGLLMLGVLGYALNVWSPVVVDAAQRERLPVTATEFLNQAAPPGPIFNSYNWGGYLMFAAPQYPVFIDGRTDVYGEFLRVYLNTALAGRGWQQTLDDFGINTVIVELNSALDVALRADDRWRLAYADDLAVVHVRIAAEA